MSFRHYIYVSEIGASTSFGTPEEAVATHV